MRLMRTASSPSLISISAMPDSSSSSMSFLILRISIETTLGKRSCGPARTGSGPGRNLGLQARDGGAGGELVALGAEAEDDARGNVGEIRAVPEGLARMDVGQ